MAVTAQSPLGKIKLILTGIPAALAILAAAPAAAAAWVRLGAALVEPGLKLSPPIAAAPKSAPIVALTLDLCGGKTDRRIFDVLLRDNIAATLFVTGLWLQNPANSAIIAAIRSRPQQFEIGNHGAKHRTAIDGSERLYGLPSAGSLPGVCAEASGGLQAIKKAGLAEQCGAIVWYRGAAARYAPRALRLLQQAGFGIAGFSANIDAGASFPAETVQRRLAAAQDGDVLIAHMNQPRRAAGAGVAAGIALLRQRGYRFVTLSQAAALGRAPHITAPKDFADAAAMPQPQLRQVNLAASGLNCAALLRQADTGN